MIGAPSTDRPVRDQPLMTVGNVLGFRRLAAGAPVAARPVMRAKNAAILIGLVLGVTNACGSATGSNDGGGTGGSGSGGNTGGRGGAAGTGAAGTGAAGTGGRGGTAGTGAAGTAGGHGGHGGGAAGGGGGSNATGGAGGHGGAPACLPLGSPCTSGGQCCSFVCAGGCTMPVTSGTGGRGGETGAGGSSGGRGGAAGVGGAGGRSGLQDCTGLVCGSNQQIVNVRSPALGTTQCACVPVPNAGQCTDCTCGESLCVQYGGHCTGFSAGIGLLCSQNG